MQLFTTILAAATALASLASANSVHFVNQDSTNRTIHFTAQSGLETIPDLKIAGLKTANQTFPTGWIGNFYSVSEGATDVPGMLGELRFNGYAGVTFFDVSAIVNPDDVNGVKEIFPLNSNIPVSGCQTFPCDNCYNSPDDVATQATDSSALVALIGNLSNERRRSQISKVRRDYITGAL
jgi:hypothetical protein